MGFLSGLQRCDMQCCHSLGRTAGLKRDVFFSSHFHHSATSPKKHSLIQWEIPGFAGGGLPKQRKDIRNPECTDEDRPIRLQQVQVVD